MTTARRTTLIDEQSGFAEARAAEKIACVKRNAMAARTVADHSEDAADCVRLLAMLGLDALEGKLAGEDDYFL